MENTANKSWADLYAGFLQDLEHKLGNRQSPSENWKSTEGVHRQMRRLLMSFADFSAVEKIDGIRIEEWNPLSQRPVVPEKPPEIDSLDRDFQSQVRAVHYYLNTSHETLHCLLWEPFFTGNLVPDAKQFNALSLAFEGLCFWHSDIIMSPNVCALTPDNELVHRRFSISQATFHPSRAFKGLGLSDDMAILDIYLSAFCGRRTALHDADDLFARNLVRRVVKLYYMHSRSLAAVFKELKQTGTFDEFYQRFCARPGIPVLLRAPFDAATQTDEYLRWVAGTGLPALVEVSDQLLEQVRMRRSIQTRAYHAFQFLRTVRAGRLARACGSPEASAQSSLEPHLTHYIALLETAMQILCAGEGATDAAKVLEEVQVALAAADEYYEQTVRAQSQNLWLATRTLILGPPTEAIRSGDALQLGALDEADVNNGEILRKLAKLALTSYFFRVVRRGEDGKGSASLLEVMRLATDIMQCQDKLAAGQAEAAEKGAEKGAESGTGDLRLLKELQGLLHRFFNIDIIRAMWSVPLGSMSPEHGKFRELPFIFE